jgi:hypothetical protein
LSPQAEISKQKSRTGKQLPFSCTRMMIVQTIEPRCHQWFHPFAHSPGRPAKNAEMILANPPLTGLLSQKIIRVFLYCHEPTSAHHIGLGDVVERFMGPSAERSHQLASCHRLSQRSELECGTLLARQCHQ